MITWAASAALVAIFAAIPLRASAQIDSLLGHALLDAKSQESSPLLLLVPSELRAGYVLRDYIRSDAFGLFDSLARSAVAFDEIYYAATELTHGDQNAAFFAATVGVFEHESIPFDLFGHEIDLPVTMESHAQFERRTGHLPNHLYHTPEDDRDKLQHFFASAWLKSWLGMDWLVALGGEFVEAAENTLLVGGFRDPRDIHANHDGARFALRASENIDARPSKSLTLNP